MADASVSQMVLPSQAPATAAEATVTAIESITCKTPEPSNDPNSSKMDKPSKMKKKDERGRPHLINILVCLVLASTTLLELVIGYEGMLRFLEWKIEEIKADIPAVEDRNTVELKVRRKIDTRTQDPLPLSLFETHEDCLVRGAYAAYSWALPGDYTHYPDIRNQTLTWVEDSCEKMFAPQAQQPTPKLQVAIIWQHWRQEVEGLLELMKYKLGNARGWLRLKLGKVPPTQRFSPRNATDHDTTGHKTKHIRSLKPDSIYIECQTSRCHLFYLPFANNFDPNFNIGQESLITVKRRLEDLQETRASFKRTLSTLALINLSIGLLETSLSLVLFINCVPKYKKQLPRPFSWNIFSKTHWKRTWEKLDVLEKRLLAALLLSVSGGYLSLFVQRYGGNFPVVVYVGFLVLGYTGVYAFIVGFCSRGPLPLTLRQLIVNLRALSLLMLKYNQNHDTLVIKDRDPITKDTAEPTPSPTKVKEPIPNVRVISPTTTFIEDLEEEIRLRRTSLTSAPTLTLPNGHASEGTELLSDDIRHEPAYEPAVYEDVDLHSDSDSDSDSSWSVV
jgi:hypothetical protein